VLKVAANIKIPEHYHTFSGNLAKVNLNHFIDLLLLNCAGC